MAVLLLVLAIGTIAQAQTTFSTRAEAAWIVDHNTGTVLYSHNADVPLPPASMSKLMTMNMLFEALDDGRIQLDTPFSVSTRAREMGGSRMFVDETDNPTAEDLIRGIVVHSGNDATVVVAEGLAGSEDAFARLMTERARDLGLTQSTFANASGWPHPSHRMSVHDLGTLAMRLIDEFPDYYDYFAEETFTWNDITQSNRNPLLGAGLGVDGLKTGHTEAAGYGLVASAVQGDRRVTFVISGLDTAQERLDEGRRILNWAFRQFVERRVLDAGTQVAERPVWMGAAGSVGLVAEEDVDLLLPAQIQDALSARVVHDGAIEAPVSAGTQLGELVIERPGLDDVRVPLVAEADIARGGFMTRIQLATQRLAERFLGISFTGI
ncbi:D-alanyl-D-alanine carboxypeptidase [Rhodobacteraceae bacterium WD3A24]|nr:D-alanyl-D-alanine carboxypeptidase [Rhodobacteraceae bacterium WD3A24]